MTVRVALIGAGLAARSHALDIVTDPAMELAGVTAAHRDSASDIAGMFGGRVYPTVDHLTADSTVDAVVVAVPPTVVLDIAERLDPAKPCLIEKPIPVTIADRHRLSRLAARHRLAIAPFNRRYQPASHRAAEFLQSGSLGAILSVDAGWRGPYSARFAPGSGTYRSAAGHRHGVLLDTGSHALDVIGVLLRGLPEPGRVTCRSTLNSRGAETDAYLDIQADAPIRLSLVDDPTAADCGDWSVSVNCESGSVQLGPDGCRVQSARPRQYAQSGEPMERPVTDLLRMVDGDMPLGTPLTEVLAIADLIIAAHERAHTPAAWIRPRGKALGRLNGSC